MDHTIRDRQHSVAQHGVANTALLHRLEEKSLGIERLQTLSQIVNYPSGIGKLDKAFSRGRLTKDNSNSLSSIMVTMVSVLHFFDDTFAATMIPDECRACTFLQHIIGILRMGLGNAMSHVVT